MSDPFKGIESVVAVLNSMVDLGQISPQTAAQVMVKFCDRTGDDLREYDAQLNPHISSCLQ